MTSSHSIARSEPQPSSAGYGNSGSLAEFPERGRLREDFGAGIRTLSFERRVVVAYRIERGMVVILGVFYAGKDYGPESFEG